MPVLSSGGDFDSIDMVLKYARVLANDANVTIAGDLLADTQPYTYTLLQLAFRKLQNRLENNSIETFPDEIIITGITPPPNMDPGIQISLGYDGFFNGSAMLPQPFLPSDMLVPLKIWERPTGTLNSYSPMVAAIDGLPTMPKTGILGRFEWRDNQIWLLGATQSTDIRLRYLRKMTDIGTDDRGLFPIMDCAIALAYLAVEVFATSRGGTVSKTFAEEAEKAIKQVINRTVRRKQRMNIRRKPYSRRSR